MLTGRAMRHRLLYALSALGCAAILAASAALALAAIRGTARAGHRMIASASAALRPSAPTDLRGPAAAARFGAPAVFTWRDLTAGARFRCRIDGRRFTACHSGVAYRNLAPGRHRFVVIAVAGNGLRSRAATGNAPSTPPSWQWRVRRPPGRIALSGTISALLYPGNPPIPIDVQLRDSFANKVHVRQIHLRIVSVNAPRARPGLPCTAEDFALTPYLGPAFVPRRGASVLSDYGIARRRWPTIAMRDRMANQDGCMGATLKIAYRALLRPTASHSKSRRRGKDGRR